MTKRLTKADPAAWKQAFLAYKSANERLENLEMPRDNSILDSVSDCFYEAEEALMALPAPNLTAVIDKLLIMWELELQYDQTESAQKRMVVLDLRRLQFLNGLE